MLYWRIELYAFHRKFLLAALPIKKTYFPLIRYSFILLQSRIVTKVPFWLEYFQNYLHNNFCKWFSNAFLYNDSIYLQQLLQEWAEKWDVEVKDDDQKTSNWLEEGMELRARLTSAVEISAPNFYKIWVCERGNEKELERFSFEKQSYALCSLPILS